MTGVEPRPGEREPAPPRRIEAIALCAALLFGLGQSLWSGWSSQAQVVAGGLGDARLHHYLLEHFWQWLRGAALHGSLWSPPFFYPAPDVLAYSEPLFGSALPYLAARALGAAPVAAYVAWEAALLAFGLIAAVWAFRRALAVPFWVAVASGYVFAFSPLRLGDLSQPQLLGFGFGALAFGAVVAGYRNPSRARGYWPLAAASLVAQLYCSFYLTFFWAIGFAALLAAVALEPGLRARVLAMAASRRFLILALALGVALSATPFLVHYLDSLQELGPRSWATIERNWLPRWGDYLTPSDAAWLYAPGGRAESAESARAGMSPGWVTLALALVGLWGGGGERRIARRALLILVVATLAIGNLSLWRGIYELVPGAEAVRAVGRVRLVQLFAWALGAGWGLARLGARSNLLAAVAAIALLGDQLQAPGGSPWAQRLEACQALATEVPATCDALLFSPRLEGGGATRRAELVGQVDGMWIASLAAVPAINGHSGGAPRGWSFRHAAIRSHEDESRLERSLMELAAHEPPGVELCWLRSAPLDRDPARASDQLSLVRVTAPRGEE